MMRFHNYQTFTDHVDKALKSPPTARADNLAPPRTGLRGLLLTQELDCCGHDHAD